MIKTVIRNSEAPGGKSLQVTSTEGDNSVIAPSDEHQFIVQSGTTFQLTVAGEEPEAATKPAKDTKDTKEPKDKKTAA